MAVVNDGDIVRVVTKLSYGVNDIQNTYHAEHRGGVITDELWMVAAATEIDGWYDDLYLFASTVISFDSIDFWNVTQDAPMGTMGWPYKTYGASLDDTAGTQLAPLVLFGTAAPRSQGRKYMFPPTDPFLSGGGTLELVLRNALLGFGIAVLQGITFAGAEAVFGNWSSPLARFAEWISATVVPEVKTQRRRALGVGE